uniref:Cytochrome P450 n=1 Tax=Phanerodontia chrysosporium TaxID=2822231 RepID=G5EJP2_PHACH|nr:cytochrome P450 [Phanerodontia chrysosporium]
MDYLGISILLVAALVLHYFLRKKRYRLPPGPKGLPILGNALDLPAKHEWLAYAKWGQECGSDIIYLNLAGTPVVVLNSAKAAKDLLEKRSSIYSDRPVTVMAHELIGLGRNFGLKPYGDTWREHRRLVHQHFRPENVPRYHEFTSKQIGRLLLHLLEDPSNFVRHLRIMAGASILRICYGIDVQPDNDHYLSVADEAIESIAATGNAGSYLVDSFPILRYLPSWAPGAQFKRDAAKWKEKVDRMIAEPFDYAKRYMTEGAATDYIAGLLLSAMDPGRDKTQQEIAIRDSLWAAYVGGADTSVSALATFTLAMVLYPDVQQTAQAELDRVLGKDTLPTIEDRDSLPYVTAVVKETLRWHPVTPLAVPHKVTTDDEYRGYHIPARSIVVGNVWAILHDPDRYPNPESFEPSRYLTSDGLLDPAAPDLTGRALALGGGSVPDVISHTTQSGLVSPPFLSSFDISPPLDEQSKPVKPSEEYTTGMLSHPVPFRANFKARSENVEALIRRITLSE